MFTTIVTWPYSSHSSTTKITWKRLKTRQQGALAKNANKNKVFLTIISLFSTFLFVYYKQQFFFLFSIITHTVNWKRNLCLFLYFMLFLCFHLLYITETKRISFLLKNEDFTVYVQLLFMLFSPVHLSLAEADKKHRNKGHVVIDTHKNSCSATVYCLFDGFSISPNYDYHNYICFNKHIFFSLEMYII